MWWLAYFPVQEAYPQSRRVRHLRVLSVNGLHRLVGLSSINKRAQQFSDFCVTVEVLCGVLSSSLSPSYRDFSHLDTLRTSTILCTPNSTSRSSSISLAFVAPSSLSTRGASYSPAFSWLSKYSAGLLIFSSRCCDSSHYHTPMVHLGAFTSRMLCLICLRRHSQCRGLGCPLGRCRR